MVILGPNGILITPMYQKQGPSKWDGFMLASLSMFSEQYGLWVFLRILCDLL